MKRNMEKAVAQGQAIINRRPALDLTAVEMRCLYDGFYKDKEEQGVSEAIFNLITKVFLLGLGVGKRNAE